MILSHLDKNNLHHAYLLEGEREKIVPHIFSFFEKINIKTSGNPDFCHITIDNFKIDEAFDLRSMSSNKSFASSKKIYVICINTISLDAQNVLLKMFEEPIENTHFFLVVPDANSLLKTLVSRFYFISARCDLAEEAEDAKRFLSMRPSARIDFLKDLLKADEDEETAPADSNRARALRFLNALELALHKKISRATLDIDLEFFEHIFKVREFLRMPGSSAKTLMESVALLIPEKL